MPLPLPLAVAAPAAAAGLAYLNAKSSLFYDLTLLNSALTTAGRLFYRERYDCLNGFYVLESWAKSSSHADRTLIIFEGKRHTYAEVYDRSLRYGAWLKSRFGVSKGDIVAMDFQNSDTFIFIWFALWQIGAKPAFINYNLTGKALSHCVKASTAKLCLIDTNVADNFDDDLRTELKDVDLVVLTPQLEAEAQTAPAVRQPDEDRTQEDLSKMAILIYTSGTTGLPKPAIVSWGKCIAGAAMGQKLLGLNKNETMYTAMPLYHSSAAILSFLAVLQSGSAQALGRKFSTRNFWREVRESEATMIQYVGETLRYLLAAPKPDPPSLDRNHRVHLAWGNGLRPDVWDEFKDRFGIKSIAEMYSATEGTFGLFNLSNNNFSKGAIGRNGWIYNRLMGRSIAIVAVDWATDEPLRDPSNKNLCKRVTPGEPGEMLFRLPDDPDLLKKRFQGYFNNPGATNKKILRDVLAKGDHWFRTGDVVRWGADGLVYFHDRIGDTFRWKAENVSTAEVSQTLGTHPAVSEANVYGVQLPRHDGRAGCAAVHLTPSAQPASQETFRSIAEHVRASLPRYAVPLFLRVLDGDVGQQSTGTYKQQKNVLRDLGVDPGAGGPGTLYWLRDDGYVPFQQADYKDIEGGSVKL